MLDELFMLPLVVIKELANELTLLGFVVAAAGFMPIAVALFRILDAMSRNAGFATLLVYPFICLAATLLALAVNFLLLQIFPTDWIFNTPRESGGLLLWLSLSMLPTSLLPIPLLVLIKRMLRPAPENASQAPGNTNRQGE